MKFTTEKADTVKIGIFIEADGNAVIELSNGKVKAEVLRFLSDGTFTRIVGQEEKLKALGIPTEVGKGVTKWEVIKMYN